MSRMTRRHKTPGVFHKLSEVVSAGSTFLGYDFYKLSKANLALVTALTLVHFNKEPDVTGWGLNEGSHQPNNFKELLVALLVCSVHVDKMAMTGSTTRIKKFVASFFPCQRHEIGNEQSQPPIQVLGYGLHR